MKHAIAFAIRLILSVWLIALIAVETGPWTAIGFVLILLWVEVATFHLKKHRILQ